MKRAALVWFKKDLRVTDHFPILKASTQFESVYALYIYEPNWFLSYEYSQTHLSFLNQSLRELSLDLKKLNIPLILKIGEATQVLKEVVSKYQVSTVFSHQETGVLWTYQRDLRVKETLGNLGVKWEEFPQFAVKRGILDRNQWSQFREKTINRPPLPHPVSLQKMNRISLDEQSYLDHDKILNLTNGKANRDLLKANQIGGRVAALKTLDSFLTCRGQNYLSSISSPALARENGSRISPYLSYGILSMSEVLGQLRAAKSNHKGDEAWRKSLWAFENRMWWHCHFIQKLETEPEIEHQNVNRAFDGMRESEFNQHHFKAWCEGQTGYPIVDACMRSLVKTGWLNFRMRAMLVSFGSYQLWLHWQQLGHFLARHFLDFEPGIHFSQLQMQSGVTGINAIRIYSPIKQTEDQIGIGDFIREHCPELSNIPDEYLKAPWEMPPLLLIDAGLKLGEHYPHPIVDHKTAYKEAKSKVFSWRAKATVKAEAKKVYTKHGSRRSSPTEKRHFPKQNRTQ